MTNLERLNRYRVALLHIKDVAENVAKAFGSDENCLDAIREEIRRCEGLTDDTGRYSEDGSFAQG